MVDRYRLGQLENLLRINSNSRDIVHDTSVLTCGCLVSESYFLSLASSLSDHHVCPVCEKDGVEILAEVTPLRLLYKIVEDISKEQPSGRKSFSKKSNIGVDLNDQQQQQLQNKGSSEGMNLISLFYKFAKEESVVDSEDPQPARKNSRPTDTHGREALHSHQLSSSIPSYSSPPSQSLLQQQSQQQQPSQIQRQRSHHSVQADSSIYDSPSISTSIQPINISKSSSSSPKKLGNSVVSGSGLSSAPGPSPGEDSIIPSSYQSFSISPLNESIYTDKSSFTNYHRPPLQAISSHIIGKGGEEKEYNFSKCFPFYRKLTTYSTQQVKLNFSSFSTFKSGSMIKKTPKFIGSSIHSYVDFYTGEEVTRFVLISEKKWELYEYDDSSRPRLVCCGKSTGEYGSDYNSLRANEVDEGIIIRNDFGTDNASNNMTSNPYSTNGKLNADDSNNNNTNNNNNNTNPGTNPDLRVVNEETKKRLGQWDQVYCSLSTNYLTISGTKGIMRILNVSSRGKKEDLGKPLYTYITNFPIRCMAISPSESVVACGITARERLSGKEQPFIILHKLTLEKKDDCIFKSVEPITITIPYRDPIKIMNFNATSKYLLCCTVWESRFLIIRLTGNVNDNYRKPRLIWSELSVTRKRSVDMKEGGVDMVSKNKEDDDIMMGNEGITDLQFGSLHSNTIVVASCSLTKRPPVVIRLDGVPIDGNRFYMGGAGGAGMETSSVSNNSRRSAELEEENNASQSIKSSETILRIPEVGSTIHRFASSPRGDGMCYLDKEGRIFLASIPNFQLHPTAPMKRIVVQLGEVTNAERYYESASIKFSSDGGKIYVVDRKGIFSVFDFTKGVPGQDTDIEKCKIVNI